MYRCPKLVARSVLSDDGEKMIRTDRSALLQAWYQALYGTVARSEAEVEQVMRTTESMQTEAVKGPASDNSQAIDLYA